MHLTEGLTTWGWNLGGFLVAGGLVADGLRRLEMDHIPRHAVITAGFFVASLVHVPLVPGASVHLMLNGLIGVMLGWTAAPAIFVALTLQALLFGHGSLTTLGLNTCVFAIPALMAHGVFQLHRWVGPGWLSLPAFLAGATGVLGAGTCFAGVLYLVGPEFFTAAQTTFIVHLPLAGLEGVVVAATVLYLYRVRPEALPGVSPAPPSAALGSPVAMAGLLLLLLASPASAHQATDADHGGATSASTEQEHAHLPWAEAFAGVALLLAGAALYAVNRLQGRVQALEEGAASPPSDPTDG